LSYSGIVASLTLLPQDVGLLVDDRWSHQLGPVDS